MGTLAIGKVGLSIVVMTTVIACCSTQFFPQSHAVIDIEKAITKSDLLPDQMFTPQQYEMCRLSLSENVARCNLLSARKSAAKALRLRLLPGSHTVTGRASVITESWFASNLICLGDYSDAINVLTCLPESDCTWKAFRYQLFGEAHTGIHEFGTAAQELRLALSLADKTERPEIQFDLFKTYLMLDDKKSANEMLSQMPAFWCPQAYGPLVDLDCNDDSSVDVATRLIPARIPNLQLFSDYMIRTHNNEAAALLALEAERMKQLDQSPSR